MRDNFSEESTAKINKYLQKHHQKIKFLLAGGFNTALGAVITFAVQYLLGSYIGPQIVFVIGYLIASIPAYLLMKLWVFQTKGGYLREYASYISSIFFTLVTGTITVSFFYNFLQFNEYLSQLLTILLNACISYFYVKYVVFSNRGKS